MTNGNESAFSKAAFYHPEGEFDSPQEGLTKREYFAAIALQGVLNSIPHNFKDMKPLLEYYEKEYPNKTMFECIANESVGMADALINALNETK